MIIDEKKFKNCTKLKEINCQFRKNGKSQQFKKNGKSPQDLYNNRLDFSHEHF